MLRSLVLINIFNYSSYIAVAIVDFNFEFKPFYLLHLSVNKNLKNLWIYIIQFTEKQQKGEKDKTQENMLPHLLSGSKIAVFQNTSCEWTRPLPLGYSWCWVTKGSNRPFPSSSEPHYEREAKNKAYRVEIGFIWVWTDEKKISKNYAWSFTFIIRFKRTRKWPVR